MGLRLQHIIGGELADLCYDKTTTHPISLLSGCELDESTTAFSRLQMMVSELNAFQLGGVDASKQKVDADKRRIEELTAEVDRAQEKIAEARRVLEDATARTSSLEEQLDEIRLEKFNAAKCSLEYCKRLKVTPQEGSGRMGTCRLHRNLIDSIRKQNGVKAKEAKDFMVRNRIDADVLQRASDRDNRDKAARRVRKDYLKRARTG